jgi:hypothetical protein
VGSGPEPPRAPRPAPAGIPVLAVLVVLLLERIRLTTSVMFAMLDTYGLGDGPRLILTGVIVILGASLRKPTD